MAATCTWGLAAKQGLSIVFTLPCVGLKLTGALAGSCGGVLCGTLELLSLVILLPSSVYSLRLMAAVHMPHPAFTAAAAPP